MRGGMIRVECPSYPVQIFIATMGYARDVSFDHAKAICDSFCEQVGLCVTVTATDFVYTGGWEPGVIVGLINYPRFPKAPAEIFDLAERLAADLCDGLHQQSYSIQAPDKTVWISHRSADAQGIEAGTGETEGLDAKHESPVGNADALKGDHP